MTAIKVTAEVSLALTKPVSAQTVRSELHKQGFFRWVAIQKSCGSEQNAVKGKKCCQTQKMWSINKWKQVIWSDEYFSPCFRKALHFQEVYVWRAPSKAYDRHCLLPRVKPGWNSIMIWLAISWYSVKPFVTMKCHITAKDYTFQPITIIPWLFSNGDGLFQASVHTAHIVQGWFSEYLKINNHTYHGHHNHQTWILFSLYSLYWREIFDSASSHHHHYSNFPTFPTFWSKNDTKFHCKRYKTVIYLFQERCFEWQRINNIVLITIFFVCNNIFIRSIH